MKTVVILAALVALSWAGAVPPQHPQVELKSVDAEFVARQKKVLSFFHFAHQVNPEAEYFKIGKEYDIEANIDKYTNKEAVEEFLTLYRAGFVPKHKVFSVFYEEMREETIALYKLFYFAKDFDTFYKTAAYARVHLHEDQFFYAFYIGIYHREDTQGIVLPAPYEVFPNYFTNFETVYNTYRIKMQDGFTDSKLASSFGIYKEDDHYIYYSNYSTFWSYGNEEQRLSYFTEDVGLNAYNYYYQSFFPYWLKGDMFGPLKERRGEIYFHYYQQLLARYYMHRLTNGLGEIPDFSWNKPIKTGYAPFLTTPYYPFIQRNDYYHMQTERNYEDLQFLDSYEKTFLQYLQRGHFKAFNQEVDFHNSKAINFVGNYWQSNVDLYEKAGTRNYHRSYEQIARRLLSAAPEPFDKYTVAPTALTSYMTSLRDPVFYQLYSKILKYFLQYKEYLEPYKQDQLYYEGVKINDVHIDKLVTHFDYYDYDFSNGVYVSLEEFKTKTPAFRIRQPRLNHDPFTVNIDIKSDVESDAVFKIFLGPKYDSNGYPIRLEDNWMNFIELDWFVHKLTKGQNKIERSSEDFFSYKEDSLPTSEFSKLLEDGKVPVDMSENFWLLPKRLMLPKGTESGYPFQLFVIVYPHQALPKEFEIFKTFMLDTKPFGYPFDRPVDEKYFYSQPNIFFEEVEIYHKGEQYPYTLNNPFYIAHKNQVPKQ